MFTFNENKNLKKYCREVARNVSTCLIIAALLTSCSNYANKMQEGRLVPVGKAEAATIGYCSIMKDAPFLMMHEKGYIIRKPVFREASWAKYKSFDIENLLIRVKDGSVANLVEPGMIANLSFSRDKKRVVFAMSLGTSPNATVGIVDLEMKRMDYSIDLEKRPPEKKRKKYDPVAMKDVYAVPVFAGGDRYIACSAYNHEGGVSVRIINLENKKMEIIEKAAYPVSRGNDIYFLRRQENESILVKRRVSGGEEVMLGKTTERIIGIETPETGVRLITAGKIYFVDEKNGKFIEEAGFDSLKKGFTVFDAVKSFSYAQNGEEYILVAVKRYNEKQKYSWVIYGMKAGRRE